MTGEAISTITLFDLLSSRIARKRRGSSAEPNAVDMMTARHILRMFYGDADYKPTLPLTIHWKGIGTLDTDLCWWLGYLTHNAPADDYVCMTIFRLPKALDEPVLLAQSGVKDSLRRMGIATQCLDRIRLISGRKIDFGATTTDGEALQRTYEARLY